MIDTPPPPPAPLPPPAPPGGLPVPPYARSGPPTLPPGTPAGRPRIWQAVLLVAAFGGLAGGSCAAFMAAPNSPTADLWSFVFAASMPFGAAAFALLVFRLWRRRVAEAWPTLGQAMLLVLAGGVLAIGGCGGWAVTMETVWPIAMGLAAVFVLGTALAVGAGELFVIAIFRLIFKRPGAR